MDILLKNVLTNAKGFVYDLHKRRHALCNAVMRNGFGFFFCSGAAFFIAVVENGLEISKVKLSSRRGTEGS